MNYYGFEKYFLKHINKFKYFKDIILTESISHTTMSMWYLSSIALVYMCLYCVCMWKGDTKGWKGVNDFMIV